MKARLFTETKHILELTDEEAQELVRGIGMSCQKDRNTAFKTDFAGYKHDVYEKIYDSLNAVLLNPDSHPE